MRVQELVVADDDRFQPLLLETYDLSAQLAEQDIRQPEQQVLYRQHQHEQSRPLGYLQQTVFLFQVLDLGGQDRRILFGQFPP